MRNLFLELQDTNHAFTVDAHPYSFDASDATIYAHTGNGTREAVAVIESDSISEAFSVVPVDTFFTQSLTYESEHSTVAGFLSWAVVVSTALYA